MWGRFGGLWLGKGDGGVVGGFREGSLVEKDQREREVRRAAAWF
jgi:hypothetical protein